VSQTGDDSILTIGVGIKGLHGRKSLILLPVVVRVHLIYVGIFVTSYRRLDNIFITYSVPRWNFLTFCGIQ